MAVALGAFGAHALSSGITESRRYWVTAVDYHMFHVLGMLALAAGLFEARNQFWVVRAQTSFVMGIALFSGSLWRVGLARYSCLRCRDAFWGLVLYAGLAVRWPSRFYQLRPWP